MPGVNKAKTAYKHKILSGGDAHTRRMEQCFGDAFQKGYSVVEIARVAGSKSAKYIHAALVKNGLIPSSKPGRQAKGIVLPDAFSAQLKIRELSFAQWCSGWAFEIEEAASGIAQKSVPVLNAIKRDFPSFYSTLTGAVDNVFASGSSFERHKFTVEFDFDGIEGCFTAKIEELGILTYGGSYQNALHLAIMQKKDLTAMARIESLPVVYGVGSGGVPG